MKQIKILGVLAVALTLGLSACGGKPGDDTPSEHVHTFDVSKWESNATEHWHPATCEHTKEKGDKAKHTWGDPYEIQPATCTEAGSQKVKCTVCDYEKTETLKATGHSAQPAEDSADWTIVTPATCEADGVKTYVCANCKQAVEVVIPALGHQYKKDAEGNDLIEWTTAPTCTEAGVGGHRTCERCGQEVPVSEAEAAAVGHNFTKDADGNEVITWSVEPTCEKPGKGTKHCERCNQDIAASEDEVKPLGHDIEAIGGETTPTDGTAAVRLYKCKRCGEIYMGFLANEVTNESKTHVAFEPETVAEGEEQGARFLGRPIGNALALEADGTSTNKQNGECVYCSTETGDFIEYAFRLNAEQAATLSTCRLYCDAKAADYLNGTDFWAYGRSNDEWTPGFYIDGGDERFEKNEDGTFKMVKDHAKATEVGQPGAELETEVKLGKRIEDYRYVLYVDDNVVDFDPDTENPTHGSNQNMQREEFVMPYTFHLHEGLNKIKLVMAGGYRSLFYKCIFRPYVEPTPIDVNAKEVTIEIGKTAQITSSLEGLTYTSSSNSVASVDANGLITGNRVGTATITVSKEGNYKPAKVKVTVTEVAGTFQISAETGAILPQAAEGVEAGAEWYVSGYNPSANRLRNFKKDSTVTFTFTSELAAKFNIIFNARGSNVTLADHIAVKVNGKDVAVSGQYNSANSGVDTVIGQADLVTGENANTLVITTISDNSPLQLHYIKFVPVGDAPVAHEHAWVDGAKVDKTETVSAYQNGACECGAKRVLIDVASDLNGQITKRGGKLGSNGATAKYVFPVPAEAVGKTAKLYFKGTVDNAGNYNYSYYYGKNGGSSAVQLPDGKTNTEVSFNGAAVTLPTASYSDLGMTGTNEAGAATFLVSQVTLAASNELILKRVDSFGIQYFDIFVVYE